MVELTRDERYEIAAEAIYTNELEGHRYTDEEVAIIKKFVEGDMTLDEVKKAFIEELYACLS